MTVAVCGCGRCGRRRCCCRTERRRTTTDDDDDGRKDKFRKRRRRVRSRLRHYVLPVVWCGVVWCGVVLCGCCVVLCSGVVALRAVPFFVFGVLCCSERSACCCLRRLRLSRRKGDSRAQNFPGRMAGIILDMLWLHIHGVLKALVETNCDCVRVIMNQK